MFLRTIGRFYVIILHLRILRKLLLKILRTVRSSYMLLVKETGELMSPIDSFEERHFKNNSWRNEYTKKKHAEMVASREEALTQAQAQAQEIADPVDPALSAESVVGPTTIDEYAIMTQSLGTCSWW
ncbi:hypothetical protein PanWU01x14_138380 [Parasponia andersonii]|uniref:Uncharacterized protein n=1 Tax=Parasponia andersonii TaxID=3476 RepID=A0A2P5CN89_PARAD|nr:hypothetical protein PanWU01x14_138380 [Parasponia andersonii]